MTDVHSLAKHLAQHPVTDTEDVPAILSRESRFLGASCVRLRRVLATWGSPSRLFSFDFVGLALGERLEDVVLDEWKEQRRAADSLLTAPAPAADAWAPDDPYLLHAHARAI